MTAWRVMRDWDENGRDKYGSEGVIHTSGVGEEDNAIHPISLWIILKSDLIKNDIPTP